MRLELDSAPVSLKRFIDKLAPTGEKLEILSHGEIVAVLTKQEPHSPPAVLSHASNKKIATLNEIQREQNRLWHTHDAHA